MIAAHVFDDYYEFYETETEQSPQTTRKEQVFRADKQKCASRVKFANASRHVRRTSGVNGAHRRRLSKAVA